MQAYSDPERENDPHALPDLEIFKGYEAECKTCGESVSLFPDYYGLTYADEAECPNGHKGARVVDTAVKFYWQSCFPGCVPDGEPNGPGASTAR